MVGLAALRGDSGGPTPQPPVKNEASPPMAHGLYAQYGRAPKSDEADGRVQALPVGEGGLP